MSRRPPCRCKKLEQICSDLTTQLAAAGGVFMTMSLACKENPDRGLTPQDKADLVGYFYEMADHCARIVAEVEVKVGV